MIAKRHKANTISIADFHGFANRSYEGTEWLRGFAILYVISV